MRMFTRRYRAARDAAADARSRVSAFAAACGFGGDALADIECAVGESIANAIEHGNQASGWFTVTCSFADRTLGIEVKDRGSGFSPPEAARGLPNTLRGWGIFMMRAFMDSVTFADGGTRVRLEKRLAEPTFNPPDRPA